MRVPNTVKIYNNMANVTKRFLIYVFLILWGLSQAQSKESLQKYLKDNLSYQHIKHKTAGKESHISIYQIEFKDCAMSYPVFIKKGDKTERFTVRILLSRINGITINKTKEGYYAISFATRGKSILKEYPDGELIHQKQQIIPLKKYDAKALEYIKKLQAICTKKSA